MIFFLFPVLMTACLSPQYKSPNPPQPLSVPPSPKELPLMEAEPPRKSGVLVVQPPLLDGVWRSENPEPSGNGRYAVREIKFKGSHWSMDYTLAKGKNMKTLLFSYRAWGTITLQGVSPFMAGSYQVLYQPRERFLTIMMKNSKKLKEFGFDSCFYKPNIEISVANKNCGIIISVKDCPNEYDIIRQEMRAGQEFITTGNRFADPIICNKEDRPTGFGHPLVKIQKPSKAKSRINKCF